MGSNYNGQLGHGDLVERQSWTAVEGLLAHEVFQIAAGN